jgi:hypothetical protein
MHDGTFVYLVDTRDREHQAVRTLVNDLPWLAAEMFASMGLNWCFSWFLLRLQQNRLHPSRRGDVDLLAGPLEWNDPNQFLSMLKRESDARKEWPPNTIWRLTAAMCAERGGIKWPPSVNYLVAVEAKCAYREASDASATRLKLTKGGPGKLRHTQLQVDELLEMGFDRVSLLDIIANPPSQGDGIEAWFRAADVADQSRQEMAQHLDVRLPGESPAGHWAWSAGPVVGGSERIRGVGKPLQLRAAAVNPQLDRSEVRRDRGELNSNLRDELAKLSPPRNLQVVFEF